MKSEIMEMARVEALDAWFEEKLDGYIADGSYVSVARIGVFADNLVDSLARYREKHGVSNVALGMSGGVDSALTAALFKKAGWSVFGFTLPIDQDPEETARGVRACAALGIAHEQVDLSALYHEMLAGLGAPGLEEDSKAAKIRRGNLRARLRMLTLYDRAAQLGGIVGSTDNLSELSAGFWTLHGDVGDVSPIQALYKSWEVPVMAKLMGVPEEIWRARPTDGLGIDDGDEAQLGCSYLEWDIMLMALAQGEQIVGKRPLEVLEAVRLRMRGTWFKRAGPIFFNPAPDDRFGAIAALDEKFGGVV